MLAFFIVLGLNVASATAQEVEQDPETPAHWSFDLHWMLDAENEIELAKGQTVKLGDPRVGRWAIAQRNRVGRMDRKELHNWLTVVGFYRITEAQSVLIKAIQRMDPVKNGALANNGRQTPLRMIIALCLVATPESKKDIQRILKSLDGLPHETSVQWSSAKAWLAAALVMMDDDLGRNYLISSLVDFLLSPPETDINDPEYKYPWLMLYWFYDQKIWEQLNKMSEDPAYEDRRSYIDSRIRFYTQLRRPMAYNWGLIEDNYDPELFRVGSSILGKRITLEELERLENTPLPQPRAVRNEAERQKQLHAIEKITEYHVEAIAVARCRLWRELIKK